jgi:ABC-type transport system involved in multi-copper enzyme maturation permease subunit
MRREVENLSETVRPVVALARFVMIEAGRSGLPWLVLASVAAALGVAGFLSHVAVTESVALQAALAASVLRACAVFLIAAHVAASTSREANDKVLEFLLALPISRACYYVGRLAGFAACGTAVAAVLALPLVLWSPPATVALWAASLAMETALVAAAAFLFAAVLGQLVPALAATAGLYLLARSIGAMQSLAASPLAGNSALAQAERWIVDAVALVLPRLDSATRTEWLLYGPPGPAEFSSVLAGLALYAALLTVVGLFDFHRRSL